MKDKNKKGGDFNIPKAVLSMAKTNMKRFKKKNQDFFDSKKELKKAYYNELMDLLPEVVRVLVRYGHIPQVAEIKDSLYEKLVDPGFVKAIRKALEKGEDIENIKMFPIIYRDMAFRARKQHEEDLKNNPDAQPYDLSDLTELTQLILEKKIKKMKKAGIDEDVAFDALCIIPTDKVLEDKQINYRLRVLMSALYEHAKTKDIDFGAVITRLIPQKYASVVVLFCLLERKEKYASMTDKQQEFFININGWIFDLMENMENDSIRSIINTYVSTRKRDLAANKDAARRYFLKSLPGDEYPRVRKVIDKMLEDDPDVEKFF